MSEQAEQHDKHEYRSPIMGDVTFEIRGDIGPELTRMLDFTLDKLTHRLGNRADQLFGSVTVKIGAGLVDGGGQAIAEDNLVLLDYGKMKLTLQESEDFLVQAGIFESGQRTRVLSSIKDEPWSAVVYELMHEIGHIIGEQADITLDTALSPTKYGHSAPNEAFAEAFTYWVFEAQQSPEATQVIEKACSGNSII